MKADLQVTTIGLMCPMPLRKLLKAIKEIQVGQVIELQVDDILTVTDLPLWCKKSGQQIIGTEKREGYTSFYIRRQR